MARNKGNAHAGAYKRTESKKLYSEIADRRHTVGENLSFAASEAYKLLRTNLMFSMSDESECKIVGITSALRGEGKSTTSMNLAYSLAENGKKTLLIDADMRIPVVSGALKVEPSPGLSHVLAGLSDLNSAVHKTDLSKDLLVLPAGEIPPNPSEMLSSKRMQIVLETLAKAFDYIIIDLPPINAVSDGLAVSKLLSGMILVVRQDCCDQRALAEAMRHLEFLNVKLLGFVLNAADTQKSRYRYSGGEKNKKYYKSSHGDGYGSRYGQKGKMNFQPADSDESTDLSQDIKMGGNLYV